MPVCALCLWRADHRRRANYQGFGPQQQFTGLAGPSVDLGPPEAEGVLLRLPRGCNPHGVVATMSSVLLGG